MKILIGVALACIFCTPVYAQGKNWFGTSDKTVIRPHYGATNTYVIERNGKTIGRIYVAPDKGYEIKDKDGNTLGTFTPSKPGGLGPWNHWR